MERVVAEEAEAERQAAEQAEVERIAAEEAEAARIAAAQAQQAAAQSQSGSAGAAQSQADNSHKPPSDGGAITDYGEAVQKLPDWMQQGDGNITKRSSDWGN